MKYKYDDFDIYESTHYSSEYPHYLGLHLSFKTKTNKEEFLKEIRKLLATK